MKGYLSVREISYKWNVSNVSEREPVCHRRSYTGSRTFRTIMGYPRGCKETREVICP